MFDDIASDWKNKRNFAWTPFVELLIPLISQWMRSHPLLDPNHLVFVDLGAGSGRHSEFFSQYCQRLVELDQSRPMLRKNSSPSEKLQADLTALPFRPDSVDGLLAVASLHHISGLINREGIITNMNSMVRLRGFVCITVWRFKQKRFMVLYKDHLHRSCSSCGKPLSGLNSASKRVILPEFGDVEVPWKISQKSGNIMVPRFYHLFRGVEFRKLLRCFSHRHLVSFGSGDQKNNFFFFGLK